MLSTSEMDKAENKMAKKRRGEWGEVKKKMKVAEAKHREAMAALGELYEASQKLEKTYNNPPGNFGRAWPDLKEPPNLQ